MAKYKAEWPARSTAVTLAPARNKRAQAAGDGDAHASISGVVPYWSARSILAPCASSTSIAATAPAPAAWCSAVRPKSSVASSLAVSSRVSTSGASLRAAARHSASRLDASSGKAWVGSNANGSTRRFHAACASTSPSVAARSSQCMAVARSLGASCASIAASA